MLDKNNLNNVHFIYKISKLFKISNNIIFKSLNLFKGLNFRKQIIYDKSNLKIINDSKLQAFPQRVASYQHILIFTGLLSKFKKGDKFILENI